VDGRATSDRRLARIAATLGVVAQVLSAYYFILYPALTVPSPANYFFFVAWPVLVGLTISWWRNHPWRSFILPVASIPLARLVLEIGFRFWGWMP
jgi:hypothetical protein